MSVVKLQECHLDELGYYFVKKCIQNIESRGLDDQGLYRIGGVNSRVTRLLQMCLDRKNYDPQTGQVTMPDFSDPVEWETKTITSALKNYLRNLSEPLMTYNLHPSIIEAAKIEEPLIRSNRIKNLIQQLPSPNFSLLKLLVEHLRNVANHSEKNLMTISNLGICFAPTLMRGPEENPLTIMEIKYSNVVANTLIEEFDSIFNDRNLHANNQQQQHNKTYVNSTQPIHHHHQQQQQQHLHTHLHQQPQLYAPPPPRPAPMQIPNDYQDSQFTLAPPNQLNKPFKCHNGSTNHLNDASLKNYDPSRSSNLISNSIPLMDLRPINDLKTYPFDQALMVPAEQPYQHMGNYMNNSMNYIGYFYNNNQNQLNSFPQYPIHGNKLPYNSTKVITLYACVGDTESELSFGPNEIITDVQNSAEVGWLLGTLERNGQRGLLPENYVKFI